MEHFQQRLWAEINLDHIIFNYQQARASAPGRQVFCVVKANAYGHGAAPVAQALAAAGAERFAVATPEEALQLRRHGVSQPILLLGMADAAWVKPLAKQNIALTVGSMQTAHAYAQAAERPLKVHVKVETGMSRIGLPHQSAAEDILAIAALPGLEIEGLFTHFSAADDKVENDFTLAQTHRFLAVEEELRRQGLIIPLCHLAASSAIIAHPYTHAGGVRPGIMLYGSTPIPGHPTELKPTLALRVRIAQVQAVPQGASVGYGRTWQAPRDSVIATLTVGYADGLQRILSGRLPMLVHGQEARLVGRICMDMCMLDVTDIPDVKAGDIATIIGEDGERRLTVDQVAEAAHTISHEIFCAIGLRVPRLYYQNGRLTEQICYLDKI